MDSVATIAWNHTIGTRYIPYLMIRPYNIWEKVFQYVHARRWFVFFLYAKLEILST